MVDCQSDGDAVITLSWWEVFLGAMVGVRRYMQALQENRRDRHGTGDDSGWTTHIEGACGELALAKYTSHFYTGSMGDFSAADVGRLQIRTRSKDWHDLIVKREDRDDAAIVLATGKAPCFRLVGWITAAEGKRNEWWKDPAGGRPAYFVPREFLRRMETLPRP